MIPNGPSGFVPDPRIAEYPGTMIRDWIMLCPDVPDSAYRAYCIIRAHIWEKDVKREVRLTQADIAEMIKKSEERTRKILKPLLKVGLLSVAQKREWWEYNPKLKRRERRTMNIYAVTDFPVEGYDGPKSVKDFRDRFSLRHSTDRSETTGGGAPDVSAGQTDRSETTGGSSSQVSDVSAGQTDRSETTSPAVKNDRPYKNSFQGDGDGGVSRVRASDETSPGDEPQWGVTGGRSEIAPTRLSADLIASVADKVLLKSEGLDVEEHKLLAGLADTARVVIEDMSGLSWEEYTAWLHQGWVHPDGTRAFRAFFGTFKWRLLPEQITKHALPWAQERRAAQKPSEAQGGREGNPSARTPGDVAGKSTCGVHGTTTLDGRCLPCDREAAEEERRQQEEEAAAAAAEAAGESADDQDEVSEEDAAMARKMMEELHQAQAAAAERAQKQREETRRKMEELRKAAERDRLERAF